MESSVVFPSQAHQIVSTLLHLLACSVLSFCFARRLAWTGLTLAKACLMAIFVDSWLFVFSGGVIVSGVGMSTNTAACLSGIYMCIFFYASSKMLIYVFLADKVHVVWSAQNPVGGRSRIWIVCAVVLLFYVVIFILMLVAKIGYIRPDRMCVIGLRNIASIPLLTYDVFLNIFLTSMFVWPLLKRRLANPKLRALAKRTCIAATVALGTSVVNILILTLLHGKQLGWVCLASCGFDVTVNALVIFSISRASQSLTSSHNTLTQYSVRAPVLTNHTMSTTSVFDGEGGNPGGANRSKDPNRILGIKGSIPFPHNGSVQFRGGQKGAEAGVPTPGLRTKQQPLEVKTSPKRGLTSPPPPRGQSSGRPGSSGKPKYPPTAMIHWKKNSRDETGTRSEHVGSNFQSLSKIGDFAATRDDGQGEHAITHRGSGDIEINIYEDDEENALSSPTYGNSVSYSKKSVEGDPAVTSYDWNQRNLHIASVTDVSPCVSLSAVRAEGITSKRPRTAPTTLPSSTLSTEENVNEGEGRKRTRLSSLVPRLNRLSHAILGHHQPTDEEVPQSSPSSTPPRSGKRKSEASATSDKEKTRKRASRSSSFEALKDAEDLFFRPEADKNDTSLQQDHPVQEVVYPPSPAHLAGQARSHGT